MPRRKQTPKNGRETSESEDAADMFASAQHKMTTLTRSRNRQRRAVATKHAEELDGVRKRIEARLDADSKRIAQARNDALAKHLDAVAAVLSIEKKIEGRIREMHRQCGRFVELLALVHDGRGQEALRIDLDELEKQVSSGSGG